MDVLTDGQQQMGLAQAGIAVDKQGVIERARVLRHGNGRGVGVFVGGPDHEVIKGEAGHLGQGVVLVLVGGIVVHLVPGQDHQIKSQENRSLSTP